MDVQEDAEATSQALLRLMGWDASLPVDPARLAERVGVKVSYLQEPEDIAGALWKKKGYPPAIFVAAGDDSNQQRFILAHILGHFLRDPGQDHFEQVERRSNLDLWGAASPEEAFANQFAASLLIPREALQVETEKAGGLATLASPGTIAVLALRFSVPPGLMRFRLKSLGMSSNAVAA